MMFCVYMYYTVYENYSLLIASNNFTKSKIIKSNFDYFVIKIMFDRIIKILVKFIYFELQMKICI